jgi:RES domain-containing protein
LDVDAISLAGIWYRQIPAGADPLYRPPHPADSRWQRGSIVDAIYLADSEPTAWAEWYRALAEAALPPSRALPRDLWRWEIDLPRVADLRTEAQRARVELPPLDPTRRQWPAYQLVGEQLQTDSWPALVSASAARPEGRTLCVFRTAQRITGVSPILPPATVADPPIVPSGLRT